MVTLSVLDLATVATGSTPAQALAETTRLAGVVEGLGYNRMWVAEHHGMPAVASSAPAVVIAHLAQRHRDHFESVRAVSCFPTTLRWSLPSNSAPSRPSIRVESTSAWDAHPVPIRSRRVRCGVAKAWAPMASPTTSWNWSATWRPAMVPPLIHRPRPGGYLPEVWLLGSSLFSAWLAGQLGLPYSFAYHFAPGLIDQALETYRSSFRPSFLLGQPQAMVAVSVICASTDAEAAWLSGSSALSILQLRTGRLGLLPSPEEADEYEFSPAELAIVEEVMSTHLIGSPETVHDGLSRLLLRTDADEIMLSTRVHSYEARVQSLSLVAGTWGLERPSRLVG